MCDSKSIIRATDLLRAEGRPFFVATVVCVEGSSYRKPGARMIVSDDRWIAGSVSGGCLERDVVRRSSWVSTTGRAKTIAYDASEEGDVARSLGCGGTVHVLVEEGGGDLDATTFMAECLRAQKVGAIASVFKSESDHVEPGARLVLRADGALRSRGLEGALREQLARAAADALSTLRGTILRASVDGREILVLVEVVRPPPTLFVFGAGHDASPVANMGLSLGWDVVVNDGGARGAPPVLARGALAHSGQAVELRDRVDGCDRAVSVVMNHHVDRDRAALGMLLDSRAAYVGALGPARRTARLLAELGRAEAAMDPRLHAPVGLALGAETPEEVALSIVSEMQAELTRSPATRLGHGDGTVHAERR